MPIIHQSSYQRPWYLFNEHIETIYPALTRKVKGVNYKRERFTLSDGDFVDLDWIENDSDQLVLLSHGLEGDSNRHYIKGMAKFFSAKGWDALAWNCRSCSGEMNKRLRLYNHGEIQDIGEVIRHALSKNSYTKIVLIGFSMGGSIIMNYLGANADHLPTAIYKAIAFSSPCDLYASVKMLEQPKNKIYRKRFMVKLSEKIKKKAIQFPDQVDASKLTEIREWKDFDEFFSAPLNGYKDAMDFYRKASAIYAIPKINIPTLLINAQNDPLLDESCSPLALCKDHPNFFIETPATGGHVGFSLARSEYSWAEFRSWAFVENGR